MFLLTVKLGLVRTSFLIPNKIYIEKTLGEKVKLGLAICFGGYVFENLITLAPRAGLEPATYGLTAHRSAD